MNYYIDVKITSKKYKLTSEQRFVINYKRQNGESEFAHTLTIAWVGRLHRRCANAALWRQDHLMVGSLTRGCDPFVAGRHDQIMITSHHDFFACLARAD